MPTDEARRGPGDAPQLSAGREEPAAGPASCTSAGSSYTSSALWRRRLSSAAHARPVSTARGRPAAETDDPGGGLYERPHGQHRAPRSRPSAAKDGGRRLAMDGPSCWKASCMVAAPRGPVRRARMMPPKRGRKSGGLAAMTVTAGWECVRPACSQDQIKLSAKWSLERFFISHEHGPCMGGHFRRGGFRMRLRIRVYLYVMTLLLNP